MAYKTSKKCFFCNEETLSQKRVGRKTICEDCINDIYNLMDLGKYKSIQDCYHAEQD